MSLAVHIAAREGFVVCADSRSTCESESKKGKSRIRYEDTHCKIVPFPNEIVVSYVGRYKIKDRLPIPTFLKKLRKEVGNSASIDTLPLMILNRYLEACGNEPENTEIIVSGRKIDPDGNAYCRMFKINTADRTVNLENFEWGDPFFCCSGTRALAEEMLSDVDFGSISLKGAIELAECVLDANITVFKYRSFSAIGGPINTYVVDYENDKSGWYVDGKIVPDENI